MSQEIGKFTEGYINTHTGKEVTIRMSELSTTPETLSRLFNIADLTNKEQSGVNPVNIVLDKIISTLKEKQDIELVEYSGNRIVNIKDNFDNLLFPENAASRLPQYARYLDENRMFRTHSSAMVPEMLRDMKDSDINKIFVLYGVCFRRDVIDLRHTEAPHQLDLWKITKKEFRGAESKREDMVETIRSICQIFCEDPEIRLNETSHPYTLNGVEVEIKLEDGSWMEIMETGELKPEILKINGIANSEQYTGWAMGLGLDRLAMYAKKIKDIRLLRSSNPLVTKQMHDLSIFKEVSKRPPLKRKVSLVANKLLEEDIAEKIRELDSSIFSIIGEVRIFEETPIDNLAQNICDRLKATKGINQVNYLLEIDVNSTEGPVDDDQANNVVSEVYKTLNVTTAELLGFKQKSKK